MNVEQRTHTNVVASILQSTRGRHRGFVQKFPDLYYIYSRTHNTVSVCTQHRFVIPTSSWQLAWNQNLSNSICLHGKNLITYLIVVGDVFNEGTASPDLPHNFSSPSIGGS